MTTAPLRLYAACPDSTADSELGYLERVERTTGWCDAAGYEAVLVASGNRYLDPWAVAQVVLQTGERVRPIVSIQPLYEHPYAVAKKLATLARLHGRMPHLNLLACESRVDRLALDDHVTREHEAERLVEYARLVVELVTSPRPVHHEGSHYRVYKPAALAPDEDSEPPELFVSGSGATAAAAAGELGAVRIAPIAEAAQAGCLRLGLIARPESDTAWEVAHSRFPHDPAARLNHRLELALADPVWSEGLAAVADAAAEESRPLWLGPLECRRAASPYVVGAYRTVSAELLRHLRAGTRRFLLEPPHDEGEIEHAAIAFARAWARHASPLGLAG